MDDLISLVFFGALILLSLLSSKKKKKKKAQLPPRPRVKRPPPQRAERPWPVEPTADRTNTAETPPGPKDLMSELMKVLQGQTTPEPQARSVPPESMLDDEAETLEELDISAEDRHDEFHEKYFDQPPQQPKKRKAEVYRRARIEFNKKSLRHAFIMKEVLGQPKGLEEG